MAIKGELEALRQLLDNYDKTKDRLAASGAETDAAIAIEALLHIQARALVAIAKCLDHFATTSIKKF